jgi:hypothetical protein
MIWSSDSFVFYFWFGAVNTCSTSTILEVPPRCTHSLQTQTSYIWHSVLFSKSFTAQVVFIRTVWYQILLRFWWKHVLNLQNAATTKASFHCTLQQSMELED